MISHHLVVFIQHDLCDEGFRVDIELDLRQNRTPLYAPLLRTYIQPAQLFAAGAQLAAHTQPALWTGLMAPARRLLHVE